MLMMEEAALLYRKRRAGTARRGERGAPGGRGTAGAARRGRARNSERGGRASNGGLRGGRGRQGGGWRRRFWIEQLGAVICGIELDAMICGVELFFPMRIFFPRKPPRSAGPGHGARCRDV